MPDTRVNCDRSYPAGDPPTQRSARQAVIAIAGLIALLLAACSSDGDVTLSTSAPTTEPAPTTTAGDEEGDDDESEEEEDEPVDLGDEVEAADGFLAFSVPGGWEVDEVADELPEPVVDRTTEVEWELDEDRVRELASVENGEVLALVGMEPRFGTAEYGPWSSALLDALIDGEGAQVGFELPHEWLGEDGDRAIGSLPDGGWFQLDTVQSGTQFIAVLAVGDEQPSDATMSELDAMIDTIEIDESVLPTFQHALDARISGSPDDPAIGLFTASFLAPMTWTLVSEGTSVLYEDEETGGWATLSTWLADPNMDLDAEIEADLADDEFFEMEIVEVAAEADGLDYLILYEGDPDEAVAAAVYATDGALVLSAYWYTPDDPELLAEVLDSLVFIDFNT